MSHVLLYPNETFLNSSYILKKITIKRRFGDLPLCFYSTNDLIVWTVFQSFKKRWRKKIPLLCREFKIINETMHDVPALCNIMNRAPDCHTHWIRVYNTIPENTTTCVTSCLNAGIPIKKNSLSTSVSLKVYFIYEVCCCKTILLNRKVIHLQWLAHFALADNVFCAADIQLFSWITVLSFLPVGSPIIHFNELDFA